MRLSAADGNCFDYHVYDYLIGAFRKDLCWADDVLNQVGVGVATIDAFGQGRECVSRVEQRRSVLIITALKWVALDLPEEEEGKEHKINIPELFGLRDPELVVVR